jgi:putative ABC transport system permease protein
LPENSGRRLVGERAREIARRLLAPWRADLLRQAADACLRRPLRTSLSVLSVAMGVSAVVATLSVVEGARRQTLADAEQLGLDTVVVRTHPPGMNPPPRPSSRLAFRDALGLRQLGASVASVDAVIEGGVELVGPVRTQYGWVIAATSDYPAATRLEAVRGRLLTTVDADAGARVCALGAALARDLFGDANPLGRSLGVAQEQYEVVGVLAERSPGRGPDYPGVPVVDAGRVVVVPLSARLGHAPEQEPWRLVDEIRVRAANPDEVETMGAIVARALAAARVGDPTYTVTVPRALVDQRMRMQRTFGFVFSSVALLTLTVGGIGIMNVTLASVLERIPEIGIRRSVGATRRSVATLFVIETAVLGLAGGVLGLVGGVGTSRAVAAYTGWDARISLVAAAVSFTVACAVGLLSGVYPAWRASTIAPVEAVRHE